MAVPKRRSSRHRKGIRRSHHAIGKPNLRVCSNCGTYGMPHRVCMECGFYNGVQVLQVVNKVSTKKQKKQGEE